MTREKLLPLIVACALFMENTDSTVISTSLPVIAQALGEDPIALKLALTSYLVSLAVFIPVSGWMADRFGARTVFRAALAVFMLGSLLCAVSNSLGAFVAARFVQGMGGAMMVPVGRLVILRSVEKAKLVDALALLTMPALVGPVIGPPLGGFITTYFDWRWIFLINIPIGLAGFALATAFFEDIREQDVPPLDVTGFLLSAFGCAALMLQLGFGLNALQSGLITFASAAGALIMKTMARRILARFGFRRVLAVNAIAASAFVASSALFTPSTPAWAMLGVLLIGGCFRSLQFTGVNALSYADVSNREMSSATSLASVAQQLSLSVGVTIGAFALESTQAWTGGGALTAADFRPAFVVVGLFAMCSVFWMLRLRPDAGAEVSGHVAANPPKATAHAIAEQKPLD